MKILTYNIQAAIGTQSYHKYVTQIRRQLFHSKHKTDNLHNIAGFISDYDLACIQEVDLGGRRSNYTCQVEQLLSLSNFSHLSSQENRAVRNISRHGNAILSKYPQSEIQDLKLPGRRTGRGAILSRVDAPDPFWVMNVHLSLGAADQMTQIEFMIENAPKHTPLIIAGDFNCGANSLPLQRLKHALGIKVLTTPHHKTYPSWSPRHDYDHILVTPHFNAETVSVKDIRLSDHRPLVAHLTH